MSSNDEKGKQSGLSMDRAAFLLLRVKKAFKKKKSSRKDKSPVAAATAAAIASSAGIATVDAEPSKGKPPLLRSRTLPAIIVPGINILQAQIEARYGKGCNKPRLSSPEPAVPSSLRLAVPQSRFFLTTPSPSGGAPQPTALYRLTRLLNQRGSASNASDFRNNNNHLSAADEKPRRLSWERRDVSLMSCGRLQRSSSIDSVVEAAWGGDASPSGQLSPSASPCSSHSGPAATRQRAPSPLMMAPPRLLLLSPSVGRRTKFDALGTGPFRMANLQYCTSKMQLAICSTNNHPACTEYFYCLSCGEFFALGERVKRIVLVLIVGDGGGGDDATRREA
ncbi:Hypothetical predicted protein [Cloeon dipterum]|uniref:Uncharacterized protein n=1 Tax=Cloeon dipterum TaxID=197152 RepID=A0A8S1CJL4_9INSE|nr:Hypothetical predicted protein [Cloeon dipterum]